MSRTAVSVVVRRLAHVSCWHFSDLRPCPHEVRYAPHNGLSQPAKLMTMGVILTRRANQLGS